MSYDDDICISGLRSIYLERTVTLLLASPLLTLAGFYDPFTSSQELYAALQILKRIGQVIGEAGR
ncbi:hypothetical protein H6F93_32830 [Leptolyngbya sp. FACHB-671]|uniref:hypothetical protein n=1 Tax=Leptolyngbya sp. FACHB-671 TaxID=2692812 RepID=UPI0016868E65|nr:hypothetical protein [Leptolyngbya sp. FACHB-671]MBD2072257.1 hypothetical protein [Leptolyngbya sp. FACHB-671]